MYKTWFLFVYVFYCFITVLLSEKFHCENTPLKSCNLEISAGLIPVNRTQLVQFCIELFRYRSCIILNEFKAEDFCGWPLVIENAGALLNEVCYNDSSFTQMYFAAAPCLKTVINYHEKDCEMWTDLVLAEISKHQKYERIKGTSSEECIRSVCMAECYRIYLLEVCGSKAGYVYHEILESVSFYMLKCRYPQQYLIAFNLVALIQQNFMETGHISLNQPAMP
ncbi:uncharacterized protein LOC129984818 [Argiope bruennichi]|uniref:Uncharacterized protein n=1 Tax=Argiope bruennichi TaxID=94029 RepID=A0A8T0EM16_ARGBR|nr:uncharacterized protein LOC129984818 [Argiope bruennichi]KAF8773239.1 hypothetical protein HNY73_015914 [Argiope bruennichi]